MKITIEATPKEIADLVSEVQGQPKKIFVPESANGKDLSEKACENINQTR